MIKRQRNLCLSSGEVPYFSLAVKLVELFQMVFVIIGYDLKIEIYSLSYEYKQIYEIFLFNVSLHDL